MFLSIGFLSGTNSNQTKAAKNDLNLDTDLSDEDDNGSNIDAILGLKRKSESLSPEKFSTNDTVSSKSTRHSNSSPNDSSNVNNEMLKTWKPIHVYKTYQNHHMAHMMSVYILLPSGIKDNALKITVFGNKLTVKVAMPGILENPELMHSHGMDTKEFVIKNVEYNKALSNLLGHKRGERVWWTTNIDLPRDCANNSFKQRIVHGKTSGAAILCLDMLVEDSSYNSMKKGIAIAVDDEGLDD